MNPLTITALSGIAGLAVVGLTEAFAGWVHLVLGLLFAFVASVSVLKLDRERRG